MKTDLLITPDEDVKKSAIYIGYLVLKKIKKVKEDKISIFDIIEELKKYNIIHYSQILYGLIFLHTCGIIEFKDPYIYIIRD
ncbi:MAG: hypothetical protein EAZ95_04570 [Bacteroidetes bacterium]|nr:MAG: hypothetical protein EAZ95_04570 [Bacteroidota bacterium]